MYIFNHIIESSTWLHNSFQRYEDAVRQVFRLDQGEDAQSEGEQEAVDSQETAIPTDRQDDVSGCATNNSNVGSDSK